VYLRKKSRPSGSERARRQQRISDERGKKEEGVSVSETERKGTMEYVLGLFGIGWDVGGTGVRGSRKAAKVVVRPKFIL